MAVSALESRVGNAIVNDVEALIIVQVGGGGGGGLVFGGAAVFRVLLILANKRQEEEGWDPIFFLTTSGIFLLLIGQIVSGLLLMGLTADRIGVISPYRSQNKVHRAFFLDNTLSLALGLFFRLLNCHDCAEFESSSGVVLLGGGAHRGQDSGLRHGRGHHVARALQQHAAGIIRNLHASQKPRSFFNGLPAHRSSVSEPLFFFFSCTQVGSLLREWRRINVAITRAKVNATPRLSLTHSMLFKFPPLFMSRSVALPSLAGSRLSPALQRARSLFLFSLSFVFFSLSLLSALSVPAEKADFGRFYVNAVFLASHGGALGGDCGARLAVALATAGSACLQFERLNV